jgi:hypothetical protein
MIAWKELLEASGGKLELTKCFYYILTWKFDSKGNPIPTTINEQRQITNQISVPDTFSNNIIQLLQNKIDEAHKTLGCYKCIIRNEHEEITYLKTRSDALAGMIKNYGLTHKQAKLAYNLVYIASHYRDPTVCGRQIHISNGH